MILFQYRRVPRKIRELIAELERAGFVNRGGKGRHRTFKHPKGGKLTVSGNSGDDVPKHFEREANRELEKCR